MYRLLLASLVVLALVAPALADDHGVDALPHVIAVNANADVQAEPDMADVSLNLNERANALEDARAAVEKQLQALYGIAKELGIEEKYLRTTYSSVQPQYRYVDDTRQRVFDGYQVTHQITVSIRDLKKLGPFVDKALKAKIDEINNISFSIENTDELQEQALAKAVKKARSKAEALAAAGNVKLGDVVSITESGSGYHPPQPKFGGAVRMMAMEAADSASAPPAGEIDINASVSVVYEIED